MSAPTPAAVMAAMKDSWDACTSEEMAAWRAAPHSDREVLCDHIRAVAAEMRAESIAMQVNAMDPFCRPETREAEIAAAKLLAVFADKLEGLE